MNENLNLVEILKDCPKGTKLYSTIFGEVEFGFIEGHSIYPIVLILNGGHEYLTSDGKLFNKFDGECILFPSREQRDWSKFKHTCEFKDGDIVATNSGLKVFILQRPKSDLQGNCHIGYDFETKEFFFSRERFDRLATEEEKQKLFYAIKERGYKWNAETKTLEKLVEPKFDPKTLKAFDKVLVKDDGDWIWRVDIISVPADYNDNIPYLIGDNDFDWIIPYNEETKHLVGTHEEAPEYYRYWED